MECWSYEVATSFNSEIQIVIERYLDRDRNLTGLSDIWIEIAISPSYKVVTS